MSFDILPAPRRRSRAVAAVAAALTLALAFGVMLVKPSSATAAEPSIWLSSAEVAALPTSGAAWTDVKSAADSNFLALDPNIAHRTDHNISTVAAAMVAAKLDSDTYRAKVTSAIRDVMAVEPDLTDVLAACRRLGSYAIAADLIGLSSYDPALDTQFRPWLQRMLNDVRYTGGSGGGTVAEIHERRPNNFGTDAGASRLAVALYLGDNATVARVAQVFKGWLGDRSSYAGFTFTADSSWHANPAARVGINPKGATKDGHNIDGVLPEDQHRAGSFTWPPPQESYVWGALQGAILQAEMLHRRGYDVWNWSDRALLRAVTWLHEVLNYPADGWYRPAPWVINRAYGTSFPTDAAPTGKGMAFTHWTHAGKAVTPAPAPSTSTAPAPVPTTTTAPAPAPVPTTTTAPAPAPTTTSAPAPATSATTAPAQPRFAGATTGTVGKGSLVRTSSSVVPTTGAVYVAAVTSYTNRPVVDLTGMGLSWVEVADQCSGRGSTRVTLFVGSGTPAKGVVTATYKAGVRSGAITVSAYTGVDRSSPVAAATAANSKGVAGQCSDGANTSSYSVASQSVAGDLVVSAAATRGVKHAPGAGFVERVDRVSVAGGHALTDAVADTASVQAKGSFASRVDWAVATIRLRAAG
jgi:hypothetical protein